jgi:AcrR family transcriptional regulator
MRKNFEDLAMTLAAHDYRTGSGTMGRMTAPPTAGRPSGESLEIRPPLQQRSREAWKRILDAGVSLFEEGGYEAFTIAAVCERAQVPPRAIYDRADSKDALFLAVYEHGIARVRADQAVFDDDKRWSGLSAAQVVDGAVRETAGIFTRHAAFLRSAVLISGAHPEVNRRGARYGQELGDQVTAVMLRAGDEIDQPDPVAAARMAFATVFSTLVMRTAYGPAFAMPAAGDEDFVTELTIMISRYLLRP